MRNAEKLVLGVCLVVPLAVVAALLGWPALLRWAAGPAVEPTWAVARASATSGPTQAAVSTRAVGPTPTVQAQPTAQAEATAPAQAPVGAQPAVQAHPTLGVQAPVGAQSTATARPLQLSGPSATVADFYTLVAAHEFDAAAQLWSPRMLADYPRRENLDQRFGATTSIQLRRSDLVSQNPGRATVTVDVVEVDAPAAAQHFVGNWHLVQVDGTWLLDQPELQRAP
jgi:hypothetical protein